MNASPTNLRRIETMNEPKHETLTREEQAFLIEFGKAIYAKTALKDLDSKKFNQLFPFLKQITDHLGIKLKEAVLPAPPHTPAIPDEPSPTNPPENTTPSTAKSDPPPQP
jgi:hypothetical protein